ncbi:TIGR03564 family F420-dependent LLM class oxidoreductase [Mycobacterium sp. 1274761.0]|uniref:TIGR03564 family F420-dependent LLM class oxidoreductase n=1 Tax=Mycobacterium sp. 1274761.0 TaxID=1834077 RepID=UPI0007FCDA54|nr:TIGR03564 family F420-dependent LLM class oxidoreductase [Mycobacterium sp. 1274761.0]OBK74678.1 LLM class F420-dependent oxidoreductase [Mycobacterium sp. 1274761.0]
MQMSVNIATPVGASPIDSTVQSLEKARDEGFRRVWMAQMPFDGDLLTVLAVALREVDGIEVGSAVLPIQNQHPMQMAQRALTLNTIAGARFVLGLGLTHQAVTEGMWGIPYDKPVRRMREYLDALQPLLAGEPVDVVGETVTARGALQIPGAPAPEIYLAALGPQMLKLCGRRTAGTLTWMCGPKTLGQHICPTLRAAAEEAGRPVGAVRVVAGLPISVTDDVDRARAQATELFAMYGTLPSYRAMLDREGYANPEDAAIIGNEEEVSERLDELASLGVDEFSAVIFDTSPDVRERTRALLRAKDA